MARRRNNEGNPIYFRLEVSPATRALVAGDLANYYRRLVQYIDEGRPLPSGWDVTLWWRNPGSRRSAATWQWRADDFEGAIDASADIGGGMFNQWVRDRLVDNLRRAIQQEQRQSQAERRRRLEESVKGRRRK